MEKIQVRISYRFPAEMPVKRNRWDIYEYRWSNIHYVDIEVESLDVSHVIEAMNSIQKEENDCDAMMIEANLQTNEMKIDLTRGIDMNKHTAMFADGRKVVYWVSNEDWAKNTAHERLNEALENAGYTDLIIN